jgi:ribosome-associated toxin RatA of RatAB toxin-antitoxin module
MKRIVRSAIVECSADAFYALVEDVETYPSFLPWCAAAQVRERTPEHTVATLMLAAKGLRQSFTTDNANQPGRAIDMRLVEGPFKRFGAHWRITPLSADAAKVEFSLEYEFASRAVAALLNPVFSRLADDTVTAFARRAASRGHG